MLVGKNIKNRNSSKTVEDLTPIVFARVRTKLGKHPKIKTIKALLDSGSSSTLISQQYAKKLRLRTENKTKWKTTAGEFTTSFKTKIEFSLPELHERRIITKTMHVTPNHMGYDMIIGRDLLEDLGIDIKFSTSSILWDFAEIPMRPRQATVAEAYEINDSKLVQDELKRVVAIMDAKYEPADLDKLVAECLHLKSEEKKLLFNLLKKYESLFDGTLGKWKGPPHQIQLKEGAKPYHAKPYTIPKAFEKTLKYEIRRLIRLGVLRKVNHSQWAAPTFIISKTDETVRFISDFRELNKRIKRFPFPIPKIQDLLLKLGGFQWATTLDLNMGYYHIEICPASRKYCTIVLPWGKYEYQKLPMGLCNSPDIFQEKMSELFIGFDFVREYIDDLLVTTSDSFKDHIDKLDKVFSRLQNAGLKVNAKKCSFGAHEVEYLGYLISRNGIKPQPKKIRAIHNMAQPKTRRQLRRFIGLVNFYRDIAIRRSKILAPLTALTSNKVPFKWEEKHTKAFQKMKMALSQYTMLTYPDFTKPFHIHTDASDYQLGSVIYQNNRPIAFYTRKITNPQTKYTITE